jgi:alternate signal-mediated exported protein
MNNMIKGSLAGAAGVALLTGSFGTYAVWTDDAVLGESAVTAGELSVTAVGDPQWTDLAEGDLLVPGDTVTVTQDFTVVATGENMQGKLDFAPGDAAELGDELSVDVDVAVAGEQLAGDQESGWTFDALLSAPTTVTATVTYAFEDVPDGNSAAFQGETASLTDSTFTVTQVIPGS